MAIKKLLDTKMNDKALGEFRAEVLGQGGGLIVCVCVCVSSFSSLSLVVLLL